MKDKKMERIPINQIENHAGEEVKISGFAQTIRNQGKIKFLIIRDVSGTIQTVASDLPKEEMDLINSLSMESVVEITGTAKKEDQAPGGIEITIKKISILSQAETPLPIPVVNKAGEEVELQKRLDWRWLDLRKPSNALIFKVWTLMGQSFREYLIAKNFIEIHSPKLMSSPSETGAELFEVKYFDRKAYLAQSPQFYKQMAMASGFEKVFEVGPVFRADPSFTSRHATEFTGYDLEFSYVESHQDVMDLEQNLICYIIEKIKEKYGEEIKKYFNRDLIVPEIPFPQITIKEAKEILKKLKVSSEKEGDFSPEEERAISDYIKKEKNHEFVFVTEYPADARPFYHMRLDDNPKLTKSFDLLWDGLEITTGAQREHRYEILVKQAKEKGMSLEPIQFYLNFFRYGCPPHGGLGIGPARMMIKMLGLSNIREVTYLYRGVKRLEP